MKDVNEENKSSNTNLTSPWRSLSGAVIASTLAYGLYSLTSSIFQTFAAKPLVTNNTFALRISLAVRTLVTGIAALGTFVFAIVALGLLALTIQTLLKPDGNQKTN